MDWTRDRPTWSHPELSRRVALAPHRWHVQESGTGPTVLLLPGSGASVHTWRDLIPVLAANFHVVAIDLPGHGFTQSPGGARSGLPEMAEDIQKLASHENWDVTAIVGHSAGAAVALRLTQLMPVARIVGINPALDNFDGVAGWLFPMLARLLALNPFTAGLFTMGASPERAERLIKGTGSSLDAAGYAFYGRLMRDRGHVNGALNMMSRWSLTALLAEMPQIETPCLFLTGDGDLAVPPDVATRAAILLPNAEVRSHSGFGHLLHEENPKRVAQEIRDYLRE